MKITHSIGCAILGFGAIILAACASGGTMVTANQAAQFQKGVSTRQQVVGSLGAPNSTSVADDGTRIDVYYHIHAAANGASYIPIIGILAGGANSTTNSAIFTYDKVGILLRVQTQEGQATVNTGLLNQ